MPLNLSAIGTFRSIPCFSPGAPTGLELFTGGDLPSLDPDPLAVVGDQHRLNVVLLVGLIPGESDQDGERHVQGRVGAWSNAHPPPRT
jgi:hypothetical protein